MADPGIQSRSGIQFGLEGTPGTAVPATTKYRAPYARIVDESPVTNRNENVARRLSQTGVYVPEYKASLAIAAHELTFEGGPFPYSASITNVVSGAANGGTSNAKNYVYILPLAADPSFKTYTIETFDNNDADEMQYSYCEKITEVGALGKAVTIAEAWRGRQSLPCTVTAGQAVPAQEVVLFQKGKLYIDASSIGSTQVTNTWLGYELVIDPGLKPQPTGDGDLYFNFPVGGEPKITGKVTFLNNAGATAQRVLFKAGTVRKVRFEIPGSAVGFTGTGGTFTTRMCRTDFAAYISKVDDSTINGVNVITLNYEIVDDGTLGFERTFCNLLTALP
jgi:hypothetical protein